MPIRILTSLHSHLDEVAKDIIKVQHDKMLPQSVLSSCAKMTIPLRQASAAAQIFKNLHISLERLDFLNREHFDNTARMI